MQSHVLFGEVGHALVVTAQLALVILLECLEFLPRPVHLLVRSILHLPDVCLGGTVLGAKGGGFALELLEMNLQAIALLGEVLDLAGQLVDQGLALGELAVRQLSLGGVLGDTCLGFGESDSPHFAFLDESGVLGIKGVPLVGHLHHLLKRSRTQGERSLAEAVPGFQLDRELDRIDGIHHRHVPGKDGGERDLGTLLGVKCPLSRVPHGYQHYEHEPAGTLATIHCPQVPVMSAWPGGSI